jgi:hypothetical protein
MAVPPYDLFTVGQSNIAAERFIALLQNSGVSAVADVRSILAPPLCVVLEEQSDDKPR